MMEEWRDIKGFEGLYQISNFGRVRGVDRYIKDSIGRNRFHKRKLKSQSTSKRGYNFVTISKNTKMYMFNVHRLVALAFIPNPHNKPCVNHIDLNQLNNHVSNLEWCTQKENVHHAIKNGHVSPINIKVMVMNKSTKEKIIFKSQNQASLFMGKNKQYLSNTKIKNIWENEFYSWELV